MENPNEHNQLDRIIDGINRLSHSISQLQAQLQSTTNRLNAFESRIATYLKRSSKLSIFMAFAIGGIGWGLAVTLIPIDTTFSGLPPKVAGGVTSLLRKGAL